MITLEPLDNTIGVTQQEYNKAQEALIPIINSTSEFNPETDRVVFSLETLNGDLLYTNPSPNFSIQNYENTSNPGSISSVVVFPIKDTQNAGYNAGTYNAFYNFYKIALNSVQYPYFIQEISPSRTEVRLSVNNIDSAEITELFQEFSASLQTEEGLFKDFYFNVEDSYYIANNTLLTSDNAILIKLYQPLPPTIETNTQARVMLEAAETVGFNITFPIKPIVIEDDVEYIGGPNFNIDILDEVNNSTVELDYRTLTEGTSLTSSYDELQNILNQKGISINVDYTDFNNFVHFSSAEQRVHNFYYKVSQIESYNNDINSILSITGSTSSSLSISASIASFQKEITNIITGFDGYEKYLYYTSESLSYPKSNSTQPYILQSTGSTEVLTWLGNLTSSAATYDKENQDNLWYTVPTYLREDPLNAQYEVFIEMIGQHFDTVYTYINALNQRYSGDNRLDYGLSKDLVSDTLQSLGLKLYQNNFSTDDLYSALLGINASGSLLPPTGSEVINTYITASNVAIPLDNINKETYKRLYHNLPYLLNKKGTVAGLRALITCFGIPDTILRITEFGGKDKINLTEKDYTREVFDLDTNLTSSVSSSQPLVGIKNRISDKIRIYEGSIVNGNTLSYYRSTQTSDEEHTKDVNYIEVAFSPQNEINDLITSSLNIGEYIGDPRFQSSSLTSYPELNKYRDTLFEDIGYTEPYNWLDYIRLIKYFDNSLFKMIKDFVPAKSELSTGVVIKQHMLERNRVTPPQAEISQHDYSGSILTGFISGGTGGVFDSINMLTSSVSPQITQSWTYEVDTQFGPQIITQSTQDEFYNGELSGSNILVTDGDLNIPPIQTGIESHVGGYTVVRGFKYVEEYEEPNVGSGVFTDGYMQIFWPLEVFSDETPSGRVRNLNSIPTEIAFRNEDVGNTNNSNYFNYLNSGDVITLRQTNLSQAGMIHQFTIASKTILESGTPGVSHYVFNIQEYNPSQNPTNLISNLLSTSPPFSVYMDIDFELIIDAITLDLQLQSYNNPIFNNAVNPTTSNIYQTIDYSDSVTTPTNISQIITNTAIKAPVQDSNYTSAKWSNSRYRGSRISSPDFNIKSR